MEGVGEYTMTECLFTPLVITIVDFLGKVADAVVEDNFTQISRNEGCTVIIVVVVCFERYFVVQMVCKS